jgi:hypothetical protein
MQQNAKPWSNLCRLNRSRISSHALLSLANDV